MNPLTAKKAAIKENNMLTALLKAMNIPIQLHKGIEKKLDISYQPTNIQELAQPEHQRNNYETEVITLTLLYNISVAIHMEDSRYKGLEWQVISNPRNTLINEVYFISMLEGNIQTLPEYTYYEGNKSILPQAKVIMEDAIIQENIVLDKENIPMKNTSRLALWNSQSLTDWTKRCFLVQLLNQTK